MKTISLKRKISSYWDSLAEWFMAFADRINQCATAYKLTNIILAICTGLLTIAAVYGVTIGKTHHVATAFMAGFITMLLITDAKKITK